MKNRTLQQYLSQHHPWPLLAFWLFIIIAQIVAYEWCFVGNTIEKRIINTVNISTQTLLGITLILLIKVPDWAKKVTIPIEMALREDKYKFLREKLSNPIQVFIDDNVADALEAIPAVKKESSDPIKGNIYSGMVWIITDANLETYASVAWELDKRMTKNLPHSKSQKHNKLPRGTYIWSTNIIPPEDVSIKGMIETHLKTANHLSGFETKVMDTQSGIDLYPHSVPSLLRLQLLRGSEDVDGRWRSMQTTDEYKQSLQENHKYRELYVPGLYEANLTEAAKEKADVERRFFPSMVMGDYIIYGDAVVLKWDQPSETLYLMFGQEAIRAYKELFLWYLEKYQIVKKGK